VPLADEVVPACAAVRRTAHIRVGPRGRVVVAQPQQVPEAEFDDAGIGAVEERTDQRRVDDQSEGAPLDVGRVALARILVVYPVPPGLIDLRREVMARFKVLAEAERRDQSQDFELKQIRPDAVNHRGRIGGEDAVLDQIALGGRARDLGRESIVQLDHRYSKEGSAVQAVPQLDLREAGGIADLGADDPGPFCILCIRVRFVDDGRRFQVGKTAWVCRDQQGPLRHNRRCVLVVGLVEEVLEAVVPCLVLQPDGNRTVGDIVVTE